MQGLGAIAIRFVRWSGCRRGIRPVVGVGPDLTRLWAKTRMQGLDCATVTLVTVRAQCQSAEHVSMQHLRPDVGFVLVGRHVREIERVDVHMLPQELNAYIDVTVTPAAAALQDGDGSLIVHVDARPRRVVCRDPLHWR